MESSTVYAATNVFETVFYLSQYDAFGPAFPWRTKKSAINSR